MRGRTQWPVLASSELALTTATHAAAASREKRMAGRIVGGEGE